MISKQSSITLREVTQKTLGQILKLQVAEDQDHLVAPNAVSIAEAYFEPYAWFRAIYADEEPVGFLMTYEVPERAYYYLWRLMIDKGYQRMGFGEKAVKLLIERTKSLPNATELVVSIAEGANNPAPFYQRLGFYDTGEIEDDEFVYKLKL